MAELKPIIGEVRHTGDRAGFTYEIEEINGDYSKRVTIETKDNSPESCAGIERLVRETLRQTTTEERNE